MTETSAPHSIHRHMAHHQNHTMSCMILHGHIKTFNYPSSFSTKNAMEKVEVQQLVQCITVSLASGNVGSETALLLPFVAILHLEALPREEHSGHLAMAYDGMVVMNF